MVKMMPLLAQLIWLWLLLILECDQGSGQRSRNIPSSSFVTFDGESDPPPPPPLPPVSPGSSVPLSEEELDRIQKEKTRNTVRLAATDQLNSEIITNRTRAYLNCESGEMIVKINFSAPFRGVAYSDYDRSSPCKFYGDGSKYYEMRLPLKGCGTKQEAPRLFINNIIVRFHRSLELEEDEIKTIICRYPPPQAPPPPSVVAPILESTVPVPVIVPSKLSEIELLLIICGLLFLTLLLLGIGIAYYCLKRRNIKIIRKKKISPAPSEITKVSTIFDQIRIPRATMSVESSETIPSDYPSSESDERRTIVSETSTLRNDHFRFENTAYLPDPYPIDAEKEDSITSFPLAVAHKPKIQTANFVETLLENVNLTEEELIEEHHKRTTACLYKRLPTSIYPPSIPDNDNWSQTEVESRLQLAPYCPNKTRPQLTKKNVTDYYLDYQQDTDQQEIVTKSLNKYSSPKLLQLLKTDETFITNIGENETVERITVDTLGMNKSGIQQFNSSQFQESSNSNERGNDKGSTTQFIETIESNRHLSDNRNISNKYQSENTIIERNMIGGQQFHESSHHGHHHSASDRQQLMRGNQSSSAHYQSSLVNESDRLQSTNWLVDSNNRDNYYNRLMGELVEKSAVVNRSGTYRIDNSDPQQFVDWRESDGDQKIGGSEIVGRNLLQQEREDYFQYFESAHQQHQNYSAASSSSQVHHHREERMKK